MRGAWKEASKKPRFCETCGDPLPMKLNAAGVPAYRDYVRRRFCSLSCANSRPKGGDSYQAHLFHARKMVGAKCEACDTPQNLQVHHVDQNYRNNDPSNLQTLCVRCHASWHAELKKNGALHSQRMPKRNTPWLEVSPPPA